MDSINKTTFSAKIRIIGINPYVIPPQNSLQYIFAQSGKKSGPIPVRGTLNGKPFIQTMVKYSGKWRLYLNTPMRKAAGIDVGDMAHIRYAYDPKSRTVRMHTALKNALQKDKKAQKVFNALPPSRKKEIMRYIASLKSIDAVERNVIRAIRFLSGKGRFVGRSNP